MGQVTDTTENLSLPLNVSGLVALKKSFLAAMAIIDTQLQAALTAAGDGNTAADIPYENGDSDLAAEDAQAALDELAARAEIPPFTTAQNSMVLTVVAGVLTWVTPS